MYIFTLIQDNRTALHAASSNGHDEVVRVLLAAKATVNTQSKVSYSNWFQSQKLYDIVAHLLEPNIQTNPNLRLK